MNRLRVVAWIYNTLKPLYITFVVQRMTAGRCHLPKPAVKYKEIEPSGNSLLADRRADKTCTADKEHFHDIQSTYVLTSRKPLSPI